MNTLFPLKPIYPDGFQYIPSFLSLEEETDLLEAIQHHNLIPFAFHGYEAKRKTASFGLDYSFDKGALQKGKEIPQSFQPLIEKVAKAIEVNAADFKELLITEYPPGSIITWHRDAPPFDLIAGVSLSTDCTFRLRPYQKEKQSRNAIVSLNVQRRSLYVMKGASRSEWQHSILPVKATRFSITLRTLLK